MILLFLAIWLVNAEEIIFVVEVARHGAREPLHGHDWYKPDQLHALTPQGVRQHCIIGRELAHRYSAILPDEYDPSLVYARSTDTSRTIKSAIS